MIDLHISHRFAGDDPYRQRAARRRFGTRIAMAAIVGAVSLAAAAMIYVIAMVLTVLSNMLGQQATGHIEERFKSGRAAAVAGVAVLPTR